MLLHNDAGGPGAAARAVGERFGDELVGPTLSAINDLLANFAAPNSQGLRAYVDQMLIDHPDLDATTLGADAVLAIEEFHRALFAG